jgi:regulatory protein
MTSGRSYSLLEAKAKIEAWCAYQERCFFEVHTKLSSWGMDAEDSERLVAELIKAGFLNEERFSKAYCSGKFRIKRWGRIKIRQHLKAKRLSDMCIRLGMEEIDSDEYVQVIMELAQRKWGELLRERDSWAKRAKVARFLQQRGFESDLVMDALESLNT